MKKLIITLLNGAVLCGLFLIFSNEADALPVFARRYGVACTTCHSIIPKLNHFGLAFRANGYRIPVNDEKFVKQEDVSLGAPPWKDEWPKNGVWPGAIADRPPIAVRFQLDGNIFGSGPQPRFNFDVPHEFSFYMAGTLGTGIGYWGEIELEEGKIPTLSGAFINFDHLFGTPLLNMRFGRFEPVAAPFSRFWRRLTSSDPLMTEEAPFSGAFKWKDRQQGLEIYGARTGPNSRGGVEWGLGIVNGSDTKKDTNSIKDIEWSFAYKFGGYGLTGPTEEEPASLAQANNFIDNSLKIGTFGIMGRRGIGSTESDYHRVGVKFDAFISRLNLYGAYMLGRDKLLDSNTKYESGSWFVEADYMLTPWIVPLVRYEKMDVTELLGKPTPSIRRIVPAVRLALRANVTLLVEGRFHVRDENFPASAKKRDEGRVRVDFLF